MSSSPRENASSDSADGVSLATGRRTHATCQQFEAAWRESIQTGLEVVGDAAERPDGAPRPRLETYLADIAEPERSSLLAELLALELELRSTLAGEQPAEADYLAALPADANVIAKVFRQWQVASDDSQATGYMKGPGDARANGGSGATKHVPPSTGMSGGPQVDGYVILDVLGRGGMGVVYKARDLRLKRLVALKMILAGPHAGADHLVRFRAEAETVARLQHPNIVQIFDIGQQDGHPYLTFELIEGLTLAEFAQREPQPPRVAAELVEALARAMHYAHQKGIVHRDLKPANVLLAGDIEEAASTIASRSGAPGKQATPQRDADLTVALIERTQSQSPSTPETSPGDGSSAHAAADATPTIAMSASSVPAARLPKSPLPASPEVASPTPTSGPSASGGSGTSRSASSSTVAGFSGQYTTAAGLVPKIMDFGLAKDLDAEAEFTSTGAILGTAQYMAPEQAAGRVRDIGPATDIYALGAILYALVTGHPPFQGTTPIETIQMVIGSEPLPPSRLQPRLPKDLETICLKCLQKDVARRYETAGDLADELQRFLRHEPILARSNGPLEKSWRWCRRNPLVAGLSMTLAVVFLLGLATSLWQTRQALASARSATDSRKKADALAGAETIAREEADAQRQRAEAAIAASLLDQGILLCENGDVTHGLLTMVQALEKSPQDATDVQEAIRLNIAYWQSRTCVLKKNEWCGSSMTAVAFAPDGKTFLAGDWGNHLNEPGPPMAVVRDALTGRGVGGAMNHHTKAIWRVAYSPDGTRCASVGFDGTARVIDPATRQPVGQPMQHEGIVYDLAYSPDGKYLLTASNKPGAQPNEIIGLLRVWDAETGAAAGEPVTQPGIVRTVDWSGDGSHWASGSIMVDADRKPRGGELRFWDAATRELIGEPVVQSDPVWAVAFHPQGGLLASGTDAGEVRFWDPATGQRTGKILRQRDPVTSLIFSRDGARLLAGSGENRPGRAQGGEARLWDVNTGQLVVQSLVHRMKVNDVALSPDQRTIVTACDDGAYYIWQVGGSIAPDYILSPSTGNFILAPSTGNVSYTTDGGKLITISENSSQTEMIVRHWDAGTGQPLGDPLHHPRWQPDETQGRRSIGYQLVSRPDGRWTAFSWPVVGGGHQDTWLVWDPVTEQRLEVPDEVRNSRRLSFSRDGSRLAVARQLPGDEIECRVWDVTSWQPLGAPMVVKSLVVSLQLAADGLTLYAGSDDGTVWHWSVADGRLLSATENVGTEVWQLELSPDGTRMLTGTWGGFVHEESSQLWNASDMSPVGQKYFHGLEALVQFMPSGRNYLTFATAADESVQLRFWDASGEVPRRLREKAIYSTKTALHPTGAFVALLTTANQLRLWHPATGRWIGPPMFFPERIAHLAFSPDGAGLCVSDAGGNIRSWTLPTTPAGSPQRVRSTLELLTRQRLDESGSANELTARELTTLQQSLGEAGEADEADEADEVDEVDEADEADEADEVDEVPN